MTPRKIPPIFYETVSPNKPSTITARLFFVSMTFVHVSTHVDACGRGFVRFADALSKSPYYASQINPQAVIDQFDRFKIWAGNVAAHRKGRRSLEYRLRDAAHLKGEVHNVLPELHSSLTDALSILSGARVAWDELCDLDYDTDSSNGSSIQSNDDNLEDNTELKQLLSSLSSSISRLFRLSMVIREPAPDTQNRSTISVDKTHFEEYNIAHVNAKFQSNKYLTERLGKAISARRQYLAYRQEHHQKLMKHADKIGHDAAPSEYTTNSTEATELQNKQVNDDAPIPMDDEGDTASQTSYAYFHQYHNTHARFASGSSRT